MSRERDIAWLARLREAEVTSLFDRLPSLRIGRLLEIGGGTGHQARLLAARGWDVQSVDLATSGYAAERVFPVEDYDGRHLPFPDASFDVVFSSNVLEHVPQLDEFEGELRRVLAPGGRAIHVVPSQAWRLWTSLAHYPALPKLVSRTIERRTAAAANARRARAEGANSGQAGDVVASFAGDRSLGRQFLTLVASPRHGERGNALSEFLVYFRASWWKRHFHEHGFLVEESFPSGLFYTGNMLLEAHLSLDERAKLAAILGSAATCFVLRTER